MKVVRSIQSSLRLLQAESRRQASGLSKSAIGNRKSEIAFTLLELLVVITILGILAGLSVPALKNIGKSNAQAGATRQLLDDVARARQLAISRHTTVYMVFVPPENLWWNNSWSASQLAAGTNLLDKQCAGYAFLSLRSVGDQPGRNQTHYIDEWKSLPDGSFIATNKFYYTTSIYDAAANVTYQVNPFYYTGIFPFPTETNTFNIAGFQLPYIAFNYLGQLTVNGVDIAPDDEYIPLAQGNVGYAHDVNKALIPAPADFTENPPGNSTNSMFSIVHIDRLTGRANLLQQQVQ